MRAQAQNQFLEHWVLHEIPFLLIFICRVLVVKQNRKIDQETFLLHVFCQNWQLVRQLNKIPPKESLWNIEQYTLLHVLCLGLDGQNTESGKIVISLKLKIEI